MKKPAPPSEIHFGYDPGDDWKEGLRSRLGYIKYRSHELGPNDWKERFALIREGYTIIHDRLMARARYARTINPYWLVWDWSPIEYNAWCEIRRLPLPLYPQYPVLGYFLDFADPYRRICIELDGRKYHNAEADAQRDKVLAAHGWRIFRIPGSVANRYKHDVLPEHLWHVGEEFAEEWEEDEYATYADELRRTTIDGFFEWLKENFYSRADTERAAGGEDEGDEE
jgi:very-short-patch-repair endonuclease